MPFGTTIATQNLGTAILRMECGRAGAVKDNVADLGPTTAA